MRIIPAIDIIGGRCVRLSEGDYDTEKVYFSDPLDAARRFEDAGLKRLHLVDLDGAKAGNVVNWKILERIAGQTGLKVDFSGGIKKEEHVIRAFECGAVQIAIGSLAVRSPETVSEWLDKYGPEAIIIGADVRNGLIAVSGWQEVSELRLVDFIDDYTAKGAENFLCTDISKDGRLEGPATELYSILIREFPEISLIASGGVSSMADIEDLDRAGCKAAIVGKAIYEERVSLEELAEYDKKHRED